MSEKKTTAKSTAPAKKTTAKKAPAKKAPAKKAPAKKAPAKKDKKPTTAPYGVALAIMATNPDMTKKDLIAKMKKRKIDTEKSPSAITTAFSSMRTCTRLLRENGLMATPSE